MELIEELIEIDRAVNVLEAHRVRALARLAETPDPEGRNWIAIEVAQALRMSENTAARWLNESTTLMALPLVLDAALAGDLTRCKTAILADGAQELLRRGEESEQKELLERFQASLVPGAAARTPSELKRSVTRTIARLRPVSLVEAEVDAYLARGVSVWSEQAQSVIQIRQTPDGAEVILTAIDAYAGKREDDQRTLDQRRADALVDICAHALYGPDRLDGGGGHPDAPRQTESWQGRRPAVNVTVPLSALLGSDTPAELAGFGPISADLAREIAFDPTGTWTICLLDQTGRLVHRSSTSYRPPAAMREHVLARDGVCTMPGCLRTARRCELDHIRDWLHGGATHPDNLHPLCPRHHHAKHAAGWEPERQPDGSTAWLSPTGRVYRKPANTLPTDTNPVGLDPPPF